MKTTLLVCALLVTAASNGERSEQIQKDGIYITVDPVLGNGVVSSELFDVVFISTGNSMMQDALVGHAAKTFEPGVDVGLLAEARGGEVTVHVNVIKDGRQTYARGGQGPHVIFHYTNGSTPYWAVFK
jgi:hypothetical protein